MKIFMGLVEVAGHYHKLKAGFDEIGIACSHVDLRGHGFKYEQTQDVKIFIKFIRLLGNKIKSVRDTNLFYKGILFMGILVSRIVLFVYAIFKYDVFIFGFGSSFFYFYDLPILKLFHKKIIYRFHGNDCRPPYLCGGIIARLAGNEAKDLIRMTAKKKRMLKRIERYADIIISNPLFSHFLEKPFISATNIGIPCALSSPQLKTGGELSRIGLDEGKIRVIHSPSKPKSKGTSIIQSIIMTLKRENYPIEFIEIIGQPNAVVVNELSRCDFIVDQLYSDTPMGGFAAEAAFFCKPSIIGGYAEEEIAEIYPPGKIPPSCYSHPSKIRDLVVKLVKDKDYCLEIGKKAKHFIENNWTPKHVAERYLRMIENDIPANWWYDPSKIRYVYGAGFPEEKAKEIIRSIIEEGGVKALQISDKPQLEKNFLDFAFS